MEWFSWFDEDPWLRIGERWQSSSHLGTLDGKYLFFSEDRQKLIDLIENEIKNHGFSVAKVIKAPKHNDYVACLYWTGDERKWELAGRYKDNESIKYRYYKSNADTRNGIYSDQFKNGVKNGTN